MMAIVTGAILNIILDWLFIFPFNWGIAGAAWATAISQVVSALILLKYYTRFESIKLEKQDFIPRGYVIVILVTLGLSGLIFQLSTVVSNNLFNIYCAVSIYGSNIPIAVAGITTKLYVIFTTIIIGIVQGLQPIIGFCYSAKKYSRVRKTLKLVRSLALIISIIF